MYIKHTKMICSVQGCKNTDTVFLSENSVTVNTPNICRECIKKAYKVIFAEDDTAAGDAENKDKNGGATAEVISDTKSAEKPGVKSKSNIKSQSTQKTAV